MILYLAILMKPYARDFHVVCKKEFETSMMGELNFFLGLHVKQMKHGTFLSQTKCCIELIKKFGMENAMKHILQWLHQPTLT